MRLTQEEFIERAKKIHGDKYDYSQVVYVDARTPIKIVCPIHGVFLQKPYRHINENRGCKYCSFEKIEGRHPDTITKQEFIDRARKIHGDKYDYSNTKYTTKRVAVEITCKEHGSFWQLPHQHLVGNGCPICGGSVGENLVLAWLINNGIEHIRQYTINNDNLFCSNKKFKVDFYLPKFNLIIEYNGKQHYYDGWFFKENGFEKQQERDMALRQYCKEHKIKLVEIPFYEMGNIEDILTKELKIHKNKS